MLIFCACAEEISSDKENHRNGDYESHLVKFVIFILPLTPYPSPLTCIKS